MSSTEGVLSLGGSDVRPHQFIAPKGVAQAFLDPEFRKALLLHVVKNHVPDLKTALILAVQGGAGEGKSFQAREVCSEADTYVVPLSGAALCGTYEGDAPKVLAEAYRFASSLRETSNKMTVLLVDDFDLSVAATIDDRRYTVNTQLLVGFLMNLADDPRRCGDRAVSRVPIVFTGNNFSLLHGPLIRHGRMNFFEWSPTIDQKIEIVRFMFSGVLLSRDLARIESLVQEFKDKPVSFFAALKEDLVNDAIFDVIAAGAPSLQIFEEAAARSLAGQKLEKLAQVGRTRASRFARDFLERGDGR